MPTVNQSVIPHDTECLEMLLLCLVPNGSADESKPSSTDLMNTQLYSFSLIDWPSQSRFESCDNVQPEKRERRAERPTLKSSPAQGFRGPCLAAAYWTNTTGVSRLSETPVLDCGKSSNVRHPHDSAKVVPGPDKPKTNPRSAKDIR